MLHVLTGRRETGKTTLAMYLARLAAARWVFDPRNGIQPPPYGGEKYHSMRALAQTGIVNLEAGELSEVVYTPRGDDLDRSFRAWSRLTKLWIQDVRRPIACVIDECALVETSLNANKHPIQAAIRWCRRDRSHFYLTCHRPADVPTKIRAVMDYWILFHCNLSHDLDVIDAHCGADVAAAVAQLGPRQFIVWDNARGVIKPNSLTPRQWYVELGTLRDEEEEDPIETMPVPADLAVIVDKGKLWR